MIRRGQPFIDCDIHQKPKSPRDLFPYLPKVFQERVELFGTGLTNLGGYPGGGATPGGRTDSFPPGGGPAGSDLDFMRENHLDYYNIEYGILLGQEYRPIPNLPDADYAAALSRAYNDWLIEHWLEKDERLKGGAIIPTQDPHAAAKELERIGGHPDIVGALVPNGAKFPYGNRYYDPIFDACANLDLPLIIHTGSEGPSPAGPASYYNEFRQYRPLGMMANLASMVFEGLFERYPNLRVVCVEAGYTWLPPFLWHMDADWKALGRETPWVKRSPSDYIFDHVRFTSQPMDSPEPQRRLLTVFEWAQAERTLMFASDYPHFDFDSPELSLPPMPEEMERRVFSENAREVFKLPKRAMAEVAVAD